MNNFSKLYNHNAIQSFVFALVIFLAQYISQNEKIVASQFIIAIVTFVTNYWLSEIQSKDK